MDRGAWKATVNKAAKSPTRLKQFSMLTIHSINSVFASVPISQFLPPPLLSSPGAFMLNISDPSTVWVTGCVLTITVFLFLLNGNPSQSPLRSCWRKTWSYQRKGQGLSKHKESALSLFSFFLQQQTEALRCWCQRCWKHCQPGFLSGSMEQSFLLLSVPYVVSL